MAISVRKVYLGLCLVGIVAILPFSRAEASSLVGGPAPSFELQALDGKVYSLAQLRSESYVLLVFWSTQCPFCRELLPKLNTLEKQPGVAALRVAAIDVGFEDPTHVQDYVKRYKLDYLILNDDAQKADITKAYGVVGTPTIFLISPAGAVLYAGHELPDFRRFLPAPAPGNQPGPTASQPANAGDTLRPQAQ